MRFENKEPNAHWYTRMGEPSHDSTLREARKLNLYPSVTSIIQVKNKPALESWKQQQAILAALTLPRLPGESEQAFAVRVLEDMKATGSKAASNGKAVHDYAESIINNVAKNAPAGFEQVCALLHEWIIDNLKAGLAELAMVSEDYGYAGRQDWCGWFKNGDYGILDFKTQDVKPGNKPVFYDEYIYQLSAYAEGKPMRLTSVVIGSNPLNPIIVIKDWDEKEKKDGWEIFKHLLAIWQIERGYKPHATV